MQRKTIILTMGTIAALCVFAQFIAVNTNNMSDDIGKLKPFHSVVSQSPY